MMGGAWEGMERVTGIEPVYSAWKAAALPLCYTRMTLAAEPEGPAIVAWGPIYRRLSCGASGSVVHGLITVRTVEAGHVCLPCT
jgi:hypothetical protein